MKNYFIYHVHYKVLRSMMAFIVYTDDDRSPSSSKISLPAQTGDVRDDRPTLRSLYVKAGGRDRLVCTSDIYLSQCNISARCVIATPENDGLDIS